MPSIEDIINKRVEQLRMVGLLKERLNKKSEENVPVIIDYAMKQLYENLDKTDIEEDYVSVSLDIFNLQDYYSQFVHNFDEFKNRLGKYIDMSSIEMTEDFLKTLIKSKTVLYNLWEYRTTTGNLLFYYKDLIEKLRSYLYIDANLSTDLDRGIDSIVFRTKIPTFEDVQKRELTIRK